MAENVLDMVEQLREIVGEFKRILYGDSAARTNGLVVEFGDLRRDVQAIKDDIQRLKATDVQAVRDDIQRLKTKRHNIWLWVAGYLAFAASVTFGVIGILNQVDGHNVWGLPAAVALWLAAVMAGAALILFLGGFGWLDRGPQ